MSAREDCGWTFQEDGRPAPGGKKNLCVTGEAFWILRVNLRQPEWPADCVTRLLIWKRAQDGAYVTDTGRYWPLSPDEEDRP